MTGQPLPTRQLVVLSCTIFAAVTTELLPVGLLPIMADDLGVAESRVGWLVSVYAVAVAVGAVPMAVLSRRWPRRGTLCVLLGCYALSNVVMAVSSAFGVLVAARLLGGIAHAGAFPIALALAVDLSPRQRAGRAIAIVNAGNVLALALGVPLATALGTAVGWRWSFLLAGAVAAVLTVVVRTTVPTGTAPRLTAGPSAAAVLSRPAMLGVAAAVVVLTLGHYTAYTYISPLLTGSGVELEAVGAVLFGYGATAAVGLFISGRFADTRPRTVLVAAVLLAVAVLATLTLTDTAAPAVVAAVAWGAAFGTLPTLIQTIALRAAPEDTALAPAVVNSTWNIGIGGGAVLGGALVLTHPGAVTTVAAALLLLGLLLLLRRSRPVATEPSAADARLRRRACRR